MGDFEAWLAAMPVSAVHARIEELEKELEVLRVLAAQRRPLGPSSPSTVTVHTSTEDPSGSFREADTVPPPRYTRPLSRERAAIVAVIRDHPSGMSPNQVAQALNKDPNPVQTTMSRMASAGQLVRVEQGLYRLPPHLSADQLINGAESVGAGVHTP